MSDINEQLVNLVTAEVVKMLQQRGQVQPATPSAPRADVHPPIGQCTGDYSKFPELKGKLTAPAASAASAPPSRAVPAIPGNPAPPPQSPTTKIAPLTGIITANQLQEAMNAASDGVAVLANEARLSPLANDLVRQNPTRVRRVSIDDDAPSSSAAGAAPANWLWWIEGQCPVVSEVVGRHRDQLRSIAAAHVPTSLSQVIRELAGAVRSKRVAGGILFVHNAARAVCFANRCQSLRAVVGTCGEAVEQGITELGANVLVVEYPHHGPRSMGAMVSRMLQQTPAAPTAVQRDLGDLHRCG